MGYLIFLVGLWLNLCLECWMNHRSTSSWVKGSFGYVLKRILSVDEDTESKLYQFSQNWDDPRLNLDFKVLIMSWRDGSGCSKHSHHNGL